MTDVDRGFCPAYAVITIGGQPALRRRDEEDDGIKPLPDRILTELTAHRTLALRDMLVANNPSCRHNWRVLHKFCRDVFDTVP